MSKTKCHQSQSTVLSAQESQTLARLIVEDALAAAEGKCSELGRMTPVEPTEFLSVVF